LSRVLSSAAGLLVAFALGTSACAGDERGPPSALFDGSPASAVPFALEGVDVPVVRTKTVVEHGTAGSERRRSCVEVWPGHRPSATAVARVSAFGETVTLRDAGGTALLGCDNAAGPREDDRRWCGAAYGKLHGGRLLDPRLDLLCTDAEGRPLAFAWVVPTARTRLVVVRQDGYAEAYETAASLPVRIVSSTGIDAATSSAAFDVSEHDGRGLILRRYTVEAQVAG
jgi:hypothetical protein